MHLKQKIQSLAYVIISAVRQTLSIHGKKIILICPMFLAFTLLNWINNSYAQKSYPLFSDAIKHHHMSDLHYNPSKTAAIGSLKGDDAVYIHFKTQSTHSILPHQPGLIAVKWFNNMVATVETSCGTGCTKSLIFIAPNITIACATHEYRIENLNPHQPPDYYNNIPLLVDPKRGIYICYDENNLIQTYPFPKQPSIQPPKGYFATKAKFNGKKLVIYFKNRHGEVQKKEYL